MSNFKSNMDNSDLSVKVHLPTDDVYCFNATQVALPGHSGQIELSANHSAYCGMIGVGIVKIKNNNSQDSTDDYLYYFVSSGFFEIKDNQLTLLVDSFQSYNDLDFDKAEQNKKKALDNLSRINDMNIDISGSLQKLKIAEAQLSLKTLSEKSGNNLKTQDQPVYASA